MQLLLDQIQAPAIVSNDGGDLLAANTLGRALYAPVFNSPEQPANSARFTFLDSAAPDFYPDWDRLASELVASLRSQAGRDPYDRNLQDLIGELSTRSDEFRVRWAAHNVRFHRTGSKRLHHPVVGEIYVAAGIDVFFCDPHAPWQRGSNENTNGLLRQYFPKGFDFSAVTETDLDAVADELNARPRKRFAFATPTEQLSQRLLQLPLESAERSLAHRRLSAGLGSIADGRLLRHAWLEDSLGGHDGEKACTAPCRRAPRGTRGRRRGLLPATKRGLGCIGLACR